jgi:hypothetical protein
MFYMPRGLGTEGQKLWKSVCDEFDLELEPHKRRILFDACKTADDLKRLDAAAAKEPLTVKGSMGQQVINPCMAQAQTARNALAQLLGRLGLPDTDDEAARKADKISVTRRKAAKSARLRVVGK